MNPETQPDVNAPGEVTTDQLRAAMAALLDHVDVVNGPVVRFEHDYFWSVPADAAYDMKARPAELTIGQLSESIENLEATVGDPERVLAFGLVWLGDVLRAVGHTVVR